MKRKTTRLTFTEEELADKGVRRAARKAARAADRADKAKAKHSHPRPAQAGPQDGDGQGPKERSAQLRFGKAEFGGRITKPKRRSRRRQRHWQAARLTAKSTSRTRMRTPAFRPPTRGNGLPRARRIKTERRQVQQETESLQEAEKLDKAADKANIRALHRKQQAAQPASNPISRWKQRQQIKASYYARKSGGKAGGSAANSARSAATKKAKVAAAKTARFVSTHAHMILMGGILALVILVIFSFVTSCSAVLSGRDRYGLDHFLHRRGRGHSGSGESITAPNGSRPEGRDRGYPVQLPRLRRV